MSAPYLKDRANRVKCSRGGARKRVGLPSWHLTTTNGGVSIWPNNRDQVRQTDTARIMSPR